jgi:ankyrin repeat protein
LQMTELLVAKGALISLSREWHFSSALKAASAVGDVPFLEYLVDFGGEVTPDDLGYALSILAKDGHTELASMLIDAGASLDLGYNSEREEEPALLEALRRRDLDLINRLLDAGADPNHVKTLNLPYPIQLAVKWGHRVLVNRLILEGADVNAHELVPKSQSALTLAVENGDYDMLRILLKAGAWVNDAHMWAATTPLAGAARKGDIEMIQFLFDHGSDPNDPEALQNAASPEVIDVLLARFRRIYPYGCSGFGGTLLKSAIMEGDETSVAKMLESNMDPKTLLFEKDLDPKTFSWEQRPKTSPFGFAITKAQPNRNNIVKLILKKGCDPNGIVLSSSQRRNDEGVEVRMTALVAAVGTNDQSLVRLLLQSGADINFPAKGSVKRTPLQRAAELGLYEMVEYLIRLDADVNAAPAPRNGGTALQLAALKGNLRAVSVLLCYQANVDAPSSVVNGHTALEGAAQHGRLETVKMLLNARTSQSKGYDGPQFERAKGYARENGHPEVIQLIESHQSLDPRYS